MSGDKPKFTDEQRAAIEYEGKDLLLAAAAGSGKTATLTERIAKLILEDGAEIDRMLVITFTKAAAGELKARIRKRLKDEYEEKIYSEQNKKKQIKRQIDKIGYAKICTIDSFLYSEIKQYFPLIGKLADTKIIADDDVLEMKREIMSEIVQERFEENDEIVKNKWTNLCDIISQTRATNRIDEELLLIEEKIERAGINVNESDQIDHGMYNIQNRMNEELRLRITGLLEHQISECIKLRKLIEDEGGEALKYIKNIEEDVDEIYRAQRRISREEIEFDELKGAIEEIKFGRLAAIKAEKRTPICKEYKLIREEIKEEFFSLKKEIYNYSDKICEEQNLVSEEIKETLFNAINEYRAKLDERKTSAGVMTYGDLENYAHVLICERKELGVAEKVGANYDYIFVDEYQDTNQLQDDIISTISTESRRFMVGDIKQAIYRFRGGDPSVFGRYRKEWSSEPGPDTDEKGSGKALFLRKNFRCSGNIIDFTNMVTNCLFTHSDITFTKDDLLIKGRESGANEEKVSINLIDISSAVENEIAADEAEAEFVSREITARIGEYDPVIGKIICEEDIAIIMRSPGARCETYRKELVEKGIRAKTKNSSAIFEYPAVRLVISVIRAIENPMVDEYFAGVLYSSIFGFTIDDITHIREISGEMPLYYGVKKIIEESSGDRIDLKCDEVEKWLNKYKLEAAVLPVNRLIELILREEEIEVLPEAEMPGSEEALKALRTISKTFEKEYGNAKYGNDLGEFADYLENKAKEKIESGSNDNGNAVSIISIHASKGLEFPIVYLVETDRGRNRIDETSTFLVDSELGIGSYLPHQSGVTVVDTLKRRIIADKISKDNMYEEMRLLYVAMTRARDKLIVTGRTKNAEKTLSEAQIHAHYMDEVQIANNEDYLSWILMSCYAENSAPSYKIDIVGGEYFDKNEFIPNAKKDISEEIQNPNETESIQDSVYEYNYSDISLIPAKLPAAKLNVGFIDKIIGGNMIDYNDEEVKSKEKEVIKDEEKDVNNNNNIVINNKNNIEENSLTVLPKFMSGKNEYDAANRGTAFHNFMQFMDLENLRMNGAEAELIRLVREKFISPKLAEEIRVKDIDKFLNSKLFKLMYETEFLKREFRFNCSLDAKRFAEDADIKRKLAESGTKITVQGVVDCILRVPDGENILDDSKNFEEKDEYTELDKGSKNAGKLVIIDYKTDLIPNELVYELQKLTDWCKERHGGQLEIYRELCERIFEERIEKKFIYLTRLGRLIEI